MLKFRGKVLFLGFGAVARCTLPIFLKSIQVSPRNVTILDFEDLGEVIKPWIEQGVRFKRERVTQENLGALLSRYSAPGDLIIDLAWNIDCCELLQWCRDHGVLYINSSVEVWDPYEGLEWKRPTERTLYFRHMNIRRLKAEWHDPAGPTAVLEHGANPGLISHWTKKGILDIAAALVADRKLKPAEAEEVKHLATVRAYNHLAQRIGIKVIHCSERDTQVASRPKEIDEFVSTWSIEGFHEEGTTTAEMGWGTHEKYLPPQACQHDAGPKHQICLAQMGINTWVRSWVPYYSIHGMIVRHGEAFTITDYLTVWEEGVAVYRPTVHYAYCPCDAAIASLHEFRGYNYRLQPKLRIMTDEIVAGCDILGALLMGHAYNSWWTGSILSIEESRQLVPNQNATTMQVACSVVAAICWMIENPNRGICVPDELPHEYILERAAPYLGQCLSIPSDWTPLKDATDFFGLGPRRVRTPRDPWQFKNFLL